MKRAVKALFIAVYFAVLICVFSSIITFLTDMMSTFSIWIFSSERFPRVLSLRIYL